MGIARKMYRESHEALNYTLRDIPGELWSRAKHRAIDEGISVRELIIRALEGYLK